MPLSLGLAGVLILAFSSVVSGYSISDTVIGEEFYNFFDWEAMPDPTHGRVNYVDQGTSRQHGLTTTTPNSFIMRADDTKVLDPSGPGRDSVRIKSKKTFTQHVVVFDVNHMPEGCGTWPAIWQVGRNWPYDGEVDIVEGINNQSPNSAFLHTASGCSMPRDRPQKGTVRSDNCDSFATNNEGCGVRFPTANSFGPEFNGNNGGWFAVERTQHHYKMWFWPRNDRTVPAEVKLGHSSVNPETWGTPEAYFPDTNCDFPSHFGEHNIIINLTFCGDWAGAAYPSSGCPSTCVDYVNNNPAAFTNAFFNFASIRIYNPSDIYDMDLGAVDRVVPL